MSVHWSAEKELKLAKLIYEREIGNFLREKASRAGAVRSVPGRYPHITELCVTVPVARGLVVEVYEAAEANAEDISDLVEAATELARGAAEIEVMRDELREGISELRAHLRRRVATLRARGAIIDGRIGIERITASSARDLCPQVHLEVVGADLRVGSIAFPAEYPDDIDAVLDDIGPDVVENSAGMRELAADGCVGRVHPLLLAVLEVTSLPVAATLSSVHADPEPFQDIRDVDGRHLILYWHEGVLTGTFKLGEGINFQKHTITIDEDRLAIDPSGATTLGEALGDSEVFGARLVISSWRRLGRNRFRVHFENPPRPYGADGSIG